MNNVINSMKTRRSIRSFKPDMLTKEEIEQVIEAGLYAANGRNLQSPIIVAVTQKELRDRLSDVNGAISGRPAGVDPFFGAPVVLIVLADKSVPTHVYDGSLVIGNMLLAAHSMGLGSCWIHRAKEEFESDEWKELLKSLGIEGEYEGIGHCILGYIDGKEPESKERKPGRVFWVE